MASSNTNTPTHIEIEIWTEDEADTQGAELKKLVDAGTEGGGAKPKKPQSETHQNPLRMHRSSVRPFFCCGSELSLVSLPDSSQQSQLLQSNDESSDIQSCTQLFNSLAYANPKFSRKKRHSASVKSKASWILKLRGRNSSSFKSRQAAACKCSDVGDCLCDVFDEKLTFDAAKVAKINNPGARFVKKKGKCNKRNVGGGVPGTSRQTRLPRSNDHDVIWDDICISRMSINHGWMCHGLAVHNRHVVDRLCSSFQRGCELSDRSVVYQEFADLPYPVGGMSTSRRTSFLTAHTQVDYVHHLVPDLLAISKRSYYWGIMDRYEAERLLENKPEGTFLLRDSAQDDFLFSVSFRRYGRSLHARVEQWKHKFSFDSHDPGVFATDTVCGLIEHYKDPSCCMFFEPMLTQPLHRSQPFSLQHLCRSVVCSRVTYDSVNQLPIPSGIKECLKYYHYKQKVRVRKLDSNDEIPGV